MEVADHEPNVWFLLEEGGSYYLDARVSRSAVDWSVLVQLTPQEYREYHAIGRIFLDYLAARIHNFVEEYQSRDLTKSLEPTVMDAIHKWRAANA